MTNIQPTDLISASEARELLGVSHTKMTQLLKHGYIRSFRNPLDRRVKLVSKAEVLALIPKRQVEQHEDPYHRKSQRRMR